MGINLLANHWTNWKGHKHNTHVPHSHTQTRSTHTHTKHTTHNTHNTHTNTLTHTHRHTHEHTHIHTLTHTPTHTSTLRLLHMCGVWQEHIRRGPRQTTNGLLRHFVVSLSSSFQLFLPLNQLSRQHRCYSSFSHFASGVFSSIRSACCFKLKIPTHTLIHPLTHTHRTHTHTHLVLFIHFVCVCVCKCSCWPALTFSWLRSLLVAFGQNRS